MTSKEAWKEAVFECGIPYEKHSYVGYREESMKRCQQDAEKGDKKAKVIFQKYLQLRLMS